MKLPMLPMSPPRDAEIRAALRSWLAATAGPDDYLLEELGLERGQTRLDVAVVNGSISGYEIKSDYDSVRRLPGQAKRYAKVLDQATLVASPHMLASARELVPSWWGLIAVTVECGTVRFKRIRRARQNPTKDLRVIVELLWQAEALDLLEQHGLARGIRSMSRSAAWDRIVKHLNGELVERVVRNRLKARARPASLP